MAMKARIAWILLVLLTAMVVVNLAAWPTAKLALHGAHGYATKWVCSEVFITGLKPKQAIRNLPDNPLIPMMRVRVDLHGQSVHLSSIGIAERTAVYRPGFGCTLLPPGSTAEDLAPVPTHSPAPSGADDLRTAGATRTTGAADDFVIDAPPENDPPGLDRSALEVAVQAAFDEPEPERAKNTRAVVVVVGGRVVAERYADGFDAETSLTGWSMTKSWTNALVGRLVALGRVDLHDPVAVPEWVEGDARREITLDHLLRMSSGLEFEESYSNLVGDAVQMLFVGRDSGGFALRRELAGPPDSRWSYSSGTTNLITRVLRQSFDTDEAYLSFPRRELFEPLGMTSAIMELDPSGTFVGSSFGWATARDWARFGQLYLQDGVWNGERLLPEGWVQYTGTPTPAAPKGRYGAHFWLNAGQPGDPSDRPMPKAPTDLLMASGFSGQHIVVAPSKNAVVVRLGLSQDPTTWDLQDFLVPVLAALPDPAQQAAPDPQADSGSDPGAAEMTINSEPGGVTVSGSSTM